MPRTIFVSVGESIQAAIDASRAGCGEVVVGPGTYVEAINFNGKAITVRSASGNPADTIIDGNGAFHVVQCVSGEGPDSVLTIAGGNADGGGVDDSGAGMFNNNSTPTVTNCVFSGNSAAQVGGGMYNSDSSLTMANCSFSGNSAGQGGGMYDGGSSPTMTNCSFIGNTADFNGGAIHHAGGPATLTNCTFSGNTANFGGGMYNISAIGGPTLTNCTFSGNSASAGGGIYNFAFSSTVTNCILWGNTPDQIVDDFGAMSTVTFSVVEGGWTGAGFNNINADPQFVDAPFGDLRLGAGSPCIDAANKAAPELGGITEDLDGNPRFIDDPDTSDCPQAPGQCGDPPVVDMGAYEFQLPCPWDLNGDGLVAITDLLSLLAAWGTDPGGPPDFNDDGNVGIVDLLALLAAWGSCP